MRSEKSRIGIFLGYAPDQTIRKEGIGRLLSFVLKGCLASEDVSVTIAAPRWYRKSIIELLDDHDIPLGRVQLLLTPGEPYLLRIRNLSRWLDKHLGGLPRLRPQGRFIGKLKPFLNAQALQILSSSSTLEILPHLILLFALSPFLVIGALAWTLKKAITYNSAFIVNSVASPFAKGWRLLTAPARYLKFNKLAVESYEVMRRRELIKLVALVNRRAEIKSWLIPTLFWPEVGEIRAKKVIAAPDFVFFEYPANYAVPDVEKIFNKMRSTASIADAIVCYSQHVKDHHLIGGIGLDKERITVINHGVTRLDSYFEKEITYRSSDQMRMRALKIIRKYQLTRQEDYFWGLFNWDNSNFIFYSSQWRPYKNILNLIIAFHRLVTEKSRDLRLVLTANVELHPKTFNYIRQNKLDTRIFIAYDIPSNVLAAFNCLARLSVNPTLFEGGFPFTFCEAYSVGTPSVMSDIPVIRELVRSEALRSEMLFDPNQVGSIMERIEWGLDNRSQLLHSQRALYESFPSWDEVATRYISVLREPFTSRVEKDRQ